ncbi:unnamed protein product [Cuscuta epithymum]|uniref:DUF676 domain-containing protein n=1 Tax=Cuscuta epithymum TaxID=186058 RepID=A0AAV0E852_9ASTE|nr:unnamed protein product [Cuscuta epithymum]
MGSLEMESESDFNNKEAKSEMGMDEDKKKSSLGIKKKRRFKNLSFLFPCMRLDEEVPTEERPNGGGGFDVEAAGIDHRPTHLVVMVNGIIGSAANWIFPAKQFVKTYPRDVIVHCSKSNSVTLTFDGIDVTGTRLADEVISVKQRYPDLKRISFIGHSLGGLISRYAIAKLYSQGCTEKPNGDGAIINASNSDSCSQDLPKGNIAGLEPMNFITIATPHLGSRGHKQVPAFCGLYPMEKFASRASWMLGRTGRHLFLKANDKGKPPLLVQMASDSEDLPFISALEAFKRRVAYANIHFDYVVGWSTSSIRSRSELPPKGKNLKRVEKYPHIVNLEPANTTSTSQRNGSVGTSKANKYTYLEETMLKGLTKMSWDRVDVSFRGSKQRFFAHNTIQVQLYCINSDGADVIQHIIDNFVL